jgi:LPXTG-site transpeptidase (sortase) family protein
MKGARHLLGIACLAVGGSFCLAAAMLHVRQVRWQVDHAALFASGQPGARPRVAPGHGEPFARLRLARLGLDLVVAEGSDPRTLLQGPGHMEGSALPGQPDNCIIAGHRDGPFARLAAVLEGDLLEVRDAAGESLYRVASVSVVPLDDKAPLAPATEAVLTLVTCYPIRHVGPAPDRLVVRAVLVGPDRGRGTVAAPGDNGMPRSTSG